LRKFHPSWSRRHTDSAQARAKTPAALQLTGVYHNLLRRWADV
jgi:predicted 2-oxoglutarate/Fe(II)-dependent dioxygenase YbiX